MFFEPWYDVTRISRLQARFFPPAALALRHAERIPCTSAMENLDQLSATGLPVFDLNEENLQRKDW